METGDPMTAIVQDRCFVCVTTEVTMCTYKEEVQSNGKNQNAESSSHNIDVCKLLECIHVI